MGVLGSSKEVIFGQRPGKDSTHHGSLWRETFLGRKWQVHRL